MCPSVSAPRAKEVRGNAAAASRSVAALIIDSVAQYHDELSALMFLPEQRYDRSVFPTLGQYDWLAGQVLYSLVRAIKPRVLVEFSTSSGYSTTFSALAMKRNGSGRIHTVDLDSVALESAKRWIARNGLSEQVEFHLGDCRDVVPRLISEDVDILFIDTLHSFDLTEWYFRDVVPRMRHDALVHIHDVMPPEARVRIHGGPPYAPKLAPLRSRRIHLIKRFFWLLLRGRWPDPRPARAPEETLPLERLEVFPPPMIGGLQTMDGNYFEEAVVIRELMKDVDSSDAVYLHRQEPELAGIDAQRYAKLDDEMHRTDALGIPLEWNDALWCRAATLQRVAPPRRVRALIRGLRREYCSRLPKAKAEGFSAFVWR